MPRGMPNGSPSHGGNNNHWKGGRSLNGRGYVRIWLEPGHPLEEMCVAGSRYALEHRFVMAELLGRPLLRAESVHHINGDKTDNRIENLELWSSSHPAGQRVTDLVTWAKEILALYERK